MSLDIKTRKDWLGEANGLFLQAKALIEKPDGDAQDAGQRDALLQEAKACQQRAADLKDIETAAVEYKAFQGGQDAPPTSPYKTMGEWLVHVDNFYNPHYRNPLLSMGDQFKDADEPADEHQLMHKSTQVLSDGRRSKDLLEQTGSTGGFLVPVEFRPELLRVAYEDNIIRERATKIPMMHRQLNMPSLDQTGTTAGQTRMHGGVVANWTEEAAEKDETQPEFRQIQLVAHKLVCYTEASQELVDDSAISLAALLTSQGGFSGAIRWEEEYTFLRGTGAGQPLGVVPAPATFSQPRAAAGAISINDVFNMVSHHHGDNPIWHCSRSAMPSLLQLNGPAGNPSYVFIPNARDGAPATLMGFPLTYTEKLPALGTAGDLLLADWAYYLIGDRQATTVEADSSYRFRYDLIAWRAVHRVDGQPWLSAPITLADGTFQISPFVILAGPSS